VNYFTVDKACYFVDLPGYGYAQVSQKEKERWSRLMEEYFAAGRIDLGILIVDHRHAPTNNDITMARWFLDSGCPFVVVANKMDKLKKSELLPNLETIRKDLELPEGTPIIPFSAEKGNGRDDLVRKILDAVGE
jgi:GTP-binding protein